MIVSSAFLSGLLGEVIPESLISGISGKWLSLLAVAACSLGTHRGMQRRGRIAEVSGRIFLAGILLLMLLCAGQGKTEYFMEVMKDPETGFTGERWLRDLYTLLCAFQEQDFFLSGWSMQKTGKCQKTCDPGFSYSLRDHFWNAAPSSGSLWRCTP